jgi:hypothetical protein
MVSVILRTKIRMNMCPIPNGFRYLERSTLNLARNIFHPSLSMSNHNSQLTLHTDSHASDIGALRREGRKILRAKFKILRVKYRKAFGIGHMFIYILIFLEWPIIWPPRIFTFPPGTPCILYMYIIFWVFSIRSPVRNRKKRTDRKITLHYTTLHYTSVTPFSNLLYQLSFLPCSFPVLHVMKWCVEADVFHLPRITRTNI